MLGESTGDNADDAGVPAAASQHESGHSQRVPSFLGQFVGSFVDAALEGFALVVQVVNVLGQRLSAFARVGGEQFESKLGLAKAAGGVEAGADCEADVFAVEFALLVEA